MGKCNETGDGALALLIERQRERERHTHQVRINARTVILVRDGMDDAEAVARWESVTQGKTTVETGEGPDAACNGAVPTFVGLLQGQPSEEEESM